MASTMMDPHTFNELMKRDQGLARQYVDAYSQQVGANPVRPITVDDAVKLATAGIKMDYEDIKDQLTIPRAEPKMLVRTNELVDMFVQRLRNRRVVARSGPERNFNYDDRDYPDLGQSFGDIWASAFKDKVYVFVAMGYTEPLILEDDANMFPSDALMAKYDLLVETKKHERGVQGVQGSVGVASAAPQSYNHNRTKVV